MLIATVASLAIDVFLDFSSTHTERELPIDWFEGVAIFLTILIAVIVGPLNNWQKDRQFRALNERKGDRLVKVIRDGGERQIPISQVVVGDVVLLEPGDVIPCNGVFLSGHHNLLCDESSVPGKSDSIKKVSNEEFVVLSDKRSTELDPGGPSGDGELLGHADRFIGSGSKVREGVAYVVIAAGTNSLGLFIALPLIRAL